MNGTFHAVLLPVVFEDLKININFGEIKITVKIIVDFTYLLINFKNGTIPILRLDFFLDLIGIKIVTIYQSRYFRDLLLKGLKLSVGHLEAR